MKLKIRLFDAKPTFAQQFILIGWSLALASVIVLWVFGSYELLSMGVESVLLSLGRLFGLLATFFALTQFMLMGRISWIERAFGLDRLASYHRFNGYMAITLILLHPILIITSYSLASGQNYIAQYIYTIRDIPYVWLALIAQILFVLVVSSSIYIARRHLKFETWYFVHLMVYAAIVLVPFHQFVSSPELAGSTLGTFYWLSLYGFVALNILLWRFGLLIYNFIKFDFRVSRVVAETPTTTSLYIKARGLNRLRFMPGQFILVRILAPKLWWQEHPFSVSNVLDGDELRLTIRKVGDYTTDISMLTPGAKVMVAGPFGRFTREIATTDKRLFIAGGVGITPIRSLAEESTAAKNDTAILYASRNPADTILKAEIDKLVLSPHAHVVYVYSDENVKLPSDSRSGRIDGAFIEKVVPDFKDRDIYICGPPSMMIAIVADLHHLGVSKEQIHYERFSLHN